MQAMFQKLLNSTGADWFVEWIKGGRSADSGVSVTYNTALTYSSVWACVSMISRDVAGKALNVYTVADDGDRELMRYSPIRWLLNGRPNDHMTAFTFRELLTSHALLFGNGYAFISRDGSMVPRELTVLLPDAVEVELDTANRLWYKYTPYEYRNGKRIKLEPDYFPARDVLHIKGLGWDGLQGHSVISLARNDWGLGMAARKHGSQFFSQGARPSLALQTEARLDKEDAETLLQRWEERHGGSNRPAILSHGLSVQPYSMNNEDSQWIESREFQRVEVAAWFGVPPHKIGDSSKIAYNSIEAENQAYTNQTLAHWNTRWETECQSKLLTERDQRAFSKIIKHDTADIANSDIETKTSIAIQLRSGEIITQNEARRILGMPSVEEGDQFMNPNVRPADRGEETGRQETARELDARALAAQRSLIVDRMERMVNLESKAAVKAAAKGGNFVAWVDEFYDSFSGKIAESLDPVISAYSVLPGVECTTTSTAAAMAHVTDSKTALLEVAGYSDSDSLEANVTEAVSSWADRATVTATTIVGDE